MSDNIAVGQRAEPLEIDTFVEARPSSYGAATGREVLGVAALLVLCDLTIYRGEGFAGLALLFALAPLLLWWSAPRRESGTATLLVAGMLAVLAAKLIWCGSAGLAAIGFVVTVAFAMTVAGRRPYVLEGVFFAAQTLQAGYLGIVQYCRQANRLGFVIPRTSWINVALPVLAVVVFGWIFVLANPDLVISFSAGLEQVALTLQGWIEWLSPHWLEAAFWGATLWITLGLIRPTGSREVVAETVPDQPDKTSTATAESFLYPAFRNTLVTVIVLFAVYLVFEFERMWFGEFPEGFYYSGFAHEGAAWLTSALALATVLLSLVFRGEILRDPRLDTLRKLAWLWSLENLILAAAVYNRMFIYIGFNGMTRMRIVGLYGISAVVVGFILVVWKIARNRSFLWLVRRHLWTLGIALYLLALTPMDAIVVPYNVRRILKNDPAPAVQISVHPINSEGILRLLPLLESENEIIREGVRALLAEKHLQAEALASRREELGWTTFQIADRIALNRFRENRDRWARYADRELRGEVLERFHAYVYQWF